MNIFRKQFGLEPTNGEVYIIQGRYYVASKGCGRIAERKGSKGSDITFINPKDFPDPEINEHPKDWIVVKATEKFPNGGTMDAIYILNKPDCLKGHEGKDGKGKWDLTDVYNFAQTKAIMRAQSKAYNIPLYEELPDEDKRKAEDLLHIAPNKVVETNVNIPGKSAPTPQKRETPKPIITPPPPATPAATVPIVITQDPSTTVAPASPPMATAEDDAFNDFLATEGAPVDLTTTNDGFDGFEVANVLATKGDGDKIYTVVEISDVNGLLTKTNLFHNVLGGRTVEKGLRFHADLIQNGNYWNLKKVKLV
jgi:hypothetical protein